MNLEVSGDKKVEILNHHYADTCRRLDAYRKQRNRLAFYALLTMVITLFVQLYPSPTEALRVVILIFLRTSKVTRDVTEGSENLLFLFVLRLSLNVVLMGIALIYKHYRMAMDSQFAYVKLVESDINALYPNSDLFNRETKFSLAESRDFGMWSSKMYGRLLKSGCVMLAITYLLLFLRQNPIETLIGIVGFICCLQSAVYFVTTKPITITRLTGLLTSGTEN